MQPRAERKPLEESPDTAERGGGKPTRRKPRESATENNRLSEGDARDVLAGKGEKVR